MCQTQLDDRRCTVVIRESFHSIHKMAGLFSLIAIHLFMLVMSVGAVAEQDGKRMFYIFDNYFSLQQF